MSMAWKCPKCGVILKKGIPLFEDAAKRGSIVFGIATCENCGAKHSQHDVYNGKYDVPEPISSLLMIPENPATEVPESLLIEKFKAAVKKENEKDGSLLILIPPGKFLAGGPEASEGGGEPFEVELPGYYIGIHTVTNAQYKCFTDATGYPPPKVKLPSYSRKPSGWPTNSIPLDSSNYPVVHVSWEDAQAYCKWAGLRLPRELEWEKGARGIDGRKYPWGNVWDKKKCRNGANNRPIEVCSRWEYPSGRSPWGLYNMVGNLWEWCEDWYERDAYNRYKSGDCSPPNTGEYRVLRGASWTNDQWLVGSGDVFRCACRRYDPQNSRSNAYGFRVAQNLTP